MSNDLILQQFEKPIRAIVIGASGGIGNAFCEQLLQHPNLDSLYACSRSGTVFSGSNVHNLTLDYADEASIEAAAKQAASDGEINLILIATGVLHDENGLSPEKALRDLNTQGFEKNFLINTIGPALVAKHFLPHIPKDEPSLFAALSARVGSISDNHMGGWYAYRSAKAALNMVIRCTAIEVARRYKHATIIGLHPGTVDTGLSKPFQSHVKEGKLFTPEFAADSLLKVVSARSADDSGKCFAWDGEEIPA